MMANDNWHFGQFLSTQTDAYLFIEMTAHFLFQTNSQLCLTVE